MQARKNGNWYEPFDPNEVNNNYTEGNSWHYSYSVQQDIPGLIQAHGGKEKFEQFIDAIFAASDKTTGREQVDITGLMGQYAQGNEPSHHIAYLYNFVDKPQKTEEKIKYILDNFYKKCSGWFDWKRRLRTNECLVHFEYNGNLFGNSGKT
ncbi:glycoside hydrolase domain-containing protein [Chryseobacterium indoltheticum]|uniref:glycoside hydrolase domain-containing protein n=1 Tax=Chryseobacterium indoltheticum TaxID=254 RepID=UPI003F491D1C